MKEKETEIKLYNCDCLPAMKEMPDKAFDALKIGKAGEYLVCADLILKGYVAFPTEQGLPYDVIFDYNGRIFKVQVKTTQSPRNMQRKIPVKGYIFNIKRRGKRNRRKTTQASCDIFALVALDTRTVAYIPNKVDGWNNFCRIFELPEKFSNDFCFGGGIPTNFQMVDWFEPIAHEVCAGKDEICLPQPAISKEEWLEEVGKIKEVEVDEEWARKKLVPWLTRKIYVKDNRKYLIIFDFGMCLTFSKNP